MNSDITPPLDKMVLNEKLKILYMISAHVASKYPTPAWHGEYLKEIEQGIKDGTEHFIDFDEAEKRIREMTS